MRPRSSLKNGPQPVVRSRHPHAAASGRRAPGCRGGERTHPGL